MEFNWKEFKANDKTAVHCKTEKEAIDFCKQMHEHGMKWNSGHSYLGKTNWKDDYEEETCYGQDGTYADLECYEEENYTILEWSNYMNEQKENSMNLELNNLTDEQKKQIIDLAEKFKQENEIDKLDYNKDYVVLSTPGKVDNARVYSRAFTEEIFSLGLTAHTKEEAEKIRRRLLVEKELRDWAKKCKEPVDLANGMQKRWKIDYCLSGKFIGKDYCCNYASTLILFTEEKIIDQAIESIGQERLIRDYFGIEREEK